MILVTSMLSWWLGPNLMHLALMNDQRDDPFTVLSFSRGLQPQVYDARYFTPLAGLVTSEGGVLVDDYRLSHQLDGQRQHTWQYLGRLQLQRARDIAQVTTASPYRLLTDLPELQQRLVGSFTPAVESWQPVVAIWLLQEFEDTESQSADPMAPLLEELGNGSGRLVWDAALTPIEEDVPWQRMLAVDFASEQEALDWLRHPDVRTARGLANARLQNLALGLFTRVPRTSGTGAR